MILSSNVFPLSIGLVGAYLKVQRGDAVDLDLFKYPEDLSAALEARQPHIVAFANYSWNFRLSYGYARWIKALWPRTVVVFGGPNYGLSEEEVAAFWNAHEAVDFHIVGEGERAFAGLVAALEAVDFDAARLKAGRLELGNCHYATGPSGAGGTVVTGPRLPRIELEELPSPYLLGLMDKFFDENLAPMIHTTRGCPFKCAFCTEGAEYYNLVKHRMNNLREEMEYIAPRVRGPRDLYITDANFAMYKQDHEKAEIIAGIQRTHDYPRYIHVSTGKNQKERVIEIASLLGSAITMTASLQSTDPVVLDNVQRSNISIDKLANASLQASRADTGTYSEIILGLPGDTFAAHRQTLRDAIEASFDNLRMYQLIMLPQTLLNTPEYRQRFDMRTRHRIMPRSFGRYRLAGHDIVAVESEEILVENATMPFEDYVTCRELDLTVEILHNGRVYGELQGLCRAFGLSWFDFIMRFYDQRRACGPGIAALYDTFSREMTAKLWPTRDDLEREVLADIGRYLDEDRGTNELSNAKARAFFELFEPINAALFSVARHWLAELGRLTPLIESYLQDLEMCSRLRKTGLFGEETFEASFGFDMAGLADERFAVLPDGYRLPASQPFRFDHSDAQRTTIGTYRREFGHSKDGYGKMLMRYPHVHRIFRHIETPV
jgi:radical SAM superfamily enzyme YgiQ (UPF0313 family)